MTQPLAKVRIRIGLSRVVQRKRAGKQLRKAWYYARTLRRALVIEQLESRALLAAEPISLADGTLFGQTGQGESQLRQQTLSISADGQLVVCPSTAGDWVPNGTNQASNNSGALSDVFRDGREKPHLGDRQRRDDRLPGQRA